MLIGGIWVDEITYNAVIEKCNKFKQSISWTLDAKFNWKNVSKLTLQNSFNFLIFYSVQLVLIIIKGIYLKMQVWLNANLHNI